MLQQLEGLCGRTTKGGTPCKIPLRGGRCMTHDSDLSARNKAVAAAFKANDPGGFVAQRSAAGKLGFQATGGMLGWEKANEFARRWRLDNPSGPEQRIIEILARLGFADYEREYSLPDGKSIDFAWPVYRIAIEVNGHQHKASFGEGEPREAGQQEKITALIEDGWKVVILDVASGEIPESKVEKLREFLARGLNHGTSAKQ